MVGVMRATLLALIVAIFPGAVSAQETGDLSGDWRVQIDGASAPSFEMSLTDQGERIVGSGRTQVCGACADAQSYDATWEGGHTGRHVVLATRYNRDPATLHRFEGLLSEDERSITGVVFHGGRQSPFRMERLRERNGAVTEEAPAESR